MMKLTKSVHKNYNLVNLHSYIKNDNLNALVNLINKNLSLITFKNFKNENILFYSLLCNSTHISSFLITKNPGLLLERNNLGRNPAQNLASKKKDLSMVFKGLSLLTHADIYKVFSNVDNLGNNLLMYCALYEDTKFFNKCINICPNIKNLQEMQNKKKSNILHFLASNSHYEGEFNLGIYDKSLFLQNTINNTTVAMFASENQPLYRFKSYIEQYKKHLSNKELLTILESENSIGFNILDFAFLNKNCTNADYLIKNFKNLFNKDINYVKFLTLIKEAIKKNSFQHYEMIFNYYSTINKKIQLEHHILLPLIHLTLQNNDKNPKFLDYLLEKHSNIFTEFLFETSNYKNGIYSKNITKINSNQWRTIFEKIALKKEKFSENNVEIIFYNILYNPKDLEIKLKEFYHFIKNIFNEDQAIIYMAKKMLYLPDSAVKNFISENDFLHKAKNKQIDTLIFLIQELYNIENPVSKKDLCLNTVLDNDSSTSELLDYNTDNEDILSREVTHINKIIKSKDLFLAFSKITKSDIAIIRHIVKQENIFDQYIKISEFISNPEKKHYFGLLLYEVSYLIGGSIEYNSKDWDKFKKIYNNYYNEQNNSIKNKSQELFFITENLEALENLLDIFKAHIIPNTKVEEQLEFLNFISKNFDKIKENNEEKTFIQDVGIIIFKNILNENKEKRESLVNNFISINDKFIEKNIPFYIPKEILSYATIESREKYQKNINDFIKLHNNYLIELRNLYQHQKIDCFLLNDIVNSMPQIYSVDEKINNFNNNQVDIYRHFNFLHKNSIIPDKKNLNDKILSLGTKIINVNTQVFTDLYYEYLKKGKMENIIKLHQLYVSNLFIIKDLNIEKFEYINIDVRELYNLHSLSIYNYHCPEKLADHVEIIIEFINSIDYKLKTIEKIMIINIADQLHILDKIPELKNIIEDYSNNTSLTYMQNVEKFIIKNKDSIVFNDINFNKILNKEVKIILEDSYMQRNMPKNKIKVKVIKY